MVTIERVKSRIQRLLSDPEITEVDGVYRISDRYFEWFLPNPDVDKFYVCKEFLERYDRYNDKLESGDTLLKVGAATGEDIRGASAQLGETGQIYAIEADPDNYTCLNKNIESHGLNNVTTTQVAVSDTSGEEVTFSKHKTSHTTHRVNDAPLMKEEDEYTSITVPTTTVDEFCEENNISEVTMLSITVNRYEAAVLKGAEKMLQDIMYVVIPFNEEEYGDAVTELEDAGFECVAEGRVGNLFKNTTI